MWWNIAASSGIKIAVKGRGIVEKRMTPSQLTKAQDCLTSAPMGQISAIA
jgi:hypothetical protein